MNYKDIFVEIVIKKRLKEIIWIFEVYLNFVLGRSNHLSIYHISFVNS